MQPATYAFRHEATIDCCVNRWEVWPWPAICCPWGLGDGGGVGTEYNHRQRKQTDMPDIPPQNDWTKPAAMAIPKEGFFKLEQGRLCWLSRGGQFPTSWELLSPEELTGSLWLSNLV
jgi:hypothetical protein